MKRFAASITLICLAYGALASGAGARSSSEPVRRISRRDALRARLTATAASADSVVVSFEDDASRAEVTEAVDAVDAEVAASLPEIGRVKVLEVEPGTAEDAVEELSDDPAVDVAELDTPRVPLTHDAIGEPLFPQQWYLHNHGQPHPVSDRFGGFDEVAGKRDADIDAPDAWELAETPPPGDPVVIAVLDVGADLAHPDIADNMWMNPAETGPGATDNSDDDGNGKKDDVSGWDFAGDDRLPIDPGNTPEAGHGTHVAALAAAATNNTGIAGVCPSCRVLHLRFGLNLSQELAAIRYIIRTLEAHPTLRLPVLNVSFGSPTWSQIERDAFDELGDRGVLTVAAAGNGGLDNDMFDFVDFEGDGIPDDFSPLYPASYELPEILSVAASNSRDQIGYATGCDRRPRSARWRCLFSNWGRDSVDVAAPGTDIKSAYLTTAKPPYRTWNGTSMAAPVVAGIAGLVKGLHPGYSVLEIKNAIMRSTDRPDSLRKLWRRPGPVQIGSYLRTNGRVNAKRALTSKTSNYYRIHDGMIAGAVKMNGSIRGSVAWPEDTNDVRFRWLRGGRRYVATLRGDNRARNIDLVLYQPGTQDVWQLEDACLGGQGTCHAIKPFAGFSRDGVEKIEFRARRSGRHYFLVSSYFVDDRYRLDVRRARN